MPRHPCPTYCCLRQPQAAHFGTRTYYKWDEAADATETLMPPSFRMPRSPDATASMSHLLLSAAASGRTSRDAHLLQVGRGRGCHGDADAAELPDAAEPRCHGIHVPPIAVCGSLRPHISGHAPPEAGRGPRATGPTASMSHFLLPAGREGRTFRDTHRQKWDTPREKRDTPPRDARMPRIRGRPTTDADPGHGSCSGAHDIRPGARDAPRTGRVRAAPPRGREGRPGQRGLTGPGPGGSTPGSSAARSGNRGPWCPRR
ncbi:hypothetical protein SAMN05880568_3212 [Microbacterium sp. RURRCA19A]|nr:hypothetical protein SAMN05880568_3212 [Microbacterium sp. RURRCA19A]